MKKAFFLAALLMLSMSIFAQNSSYQLRDTRTISACGYTDGSDIPVPPAYYFVGQDEEFLYVTSNYDVASHSYCWHWVIGCKLQALSLSMPNETNRTYCTWYSNVSLNNSEGAHNSLNQFKETNKTSILVHEEEVHEQCSSGLPCMYYYTLTYWTSGSCFRNGN